MPVVTLSSGELHYIERGRGVPLVLLHANPDDSRDFEAIMPALAQHYRVLALDWPRCCRSCGAGRPRTAWTQRFNERRASESEDAAG